MRQEVPGEARFLTYSCYQRLPLLTKDRTCRWLVEAIDRARAKHGFDLWAFVIMPEHVHLVILPGAGQRSVADILYTINKSVSNRALTWLQRNAPAFLEELLDPQPNGQASHRFWQRGGGYDRNLWSNDEVWEKIDYVHLNPVTRGLCQHPADWKWSSASAYSGVGDSALRIDFESLPPGGRSRIRSAW